MAHYRYGWPNMVLLGATGENVRHRRAEKMKGEETNQEADR